MERLFSPVSLISITHELKERALEIQYIGDMCDLGNEIGLCVSKYFENMNENEIELFVQGFKHGARIPKKID